MSDTSGIYLVYTWYIPGIYLVYTYVFLDLYLVYTTITDIYQNGPKDNPGSYSLKVGVIRNQLMTRLKLMCSGSANQNKIWFQIQIKNDRIIKSHNKPDFFIFQQEIPLTNIHT